MESTTRAARPSVVRLSVLALGALAAACGPRAVPEAVGAEPGTFEPRLVSFATPDGGLVFADEYGSGERAVVLVHGGRFDRTSWAAQARVLAAGGLRVLAVDLRGYGDSRGPAGAADPSADRHLDLLGAARWLRDGGATSVAVVGASMGGGAAAQALGEPAAGGFDRAVLLAHSPVEHPERMGAEKLFIVAREDAYGSGTLRLPGIEEQFERAPEPKKLMVLEGQAHAQYLFETDQGPRLLGAIQRFLGAPARPGVAPDADGERVR